MQRCFPEYLPAAGGGQKPAAGILVERIPAFFALITNSRLPSAAVSIMHARVVLAECKFGRFDIMTYE
jgi:hypothetical protein